MDEIETEIENMRTKVDDLEVEGPNRASAYSLGMTMAILSFGKAPATQTGPWLQHHAYRS